MKLVAVRIPAWLHEQAIELAASERAAGRHLSVQEIYGTALAAFLLAATGRVATKKEV